ncbi:hypothetical protein [Spongiivirga citrea]|uniref:Uncharacterized protein n=1 Tax=Spongiivirga citrea TaxID=1481457 RepID=A0A6M0CF00_9FLAO|nr:hypothetical protein [Spongiivirga citrea]NER16408.1 hypothetical protein [Spongiivirga citrea]
MLDQLKPVSTWEYVVLFIICLISFLIGYFFARRYYKRKLKLAIDDCNADKQSLTNQLNIKQAEVEAEMALRKKQATSAIVEKEKPIMKQAIIEEAIPNDAPKEKPKLNFESFGKADASQKDDLKRISGVGPFIENKLNSIGIYTFDQISKFTKKDIDDVTELIQFFPGRIERDNWTDQASKLKDS